VSALLHRATSGTPDHGRAENTHRSGMGGISEISEKPMDIIGINRLFR
jgi:hypothetical protein